MKIRKIIIFFLPLTILVFLIFLINFRQNKNLFSYSIENNSINSFQIPINTNDPVIGNKRNLKSIIVFADFSCSACKSDNFILEKLLSENLGAFKIIWKGLPVGFYPHNSHIAIRYAYCANKQNKFEEFEKHAYTNNLDLSSSTLDNISQEIKLDQKKLANCLNSQEVEDYIEINKSYADGLNIQKIPAYFLENKQINPKNENEWKLILNL